jgi:hypothetical protein
MPRVFAFGCSYTAYSYPTWADLLRLDFDHVENWGLPGIGNRAIAERVAECHVKNKITKDDIVIVQWSSHLRNDWYSSTPHIDRFPGWRTYGSIFNYHNANLYDKKWIDVFFHEPAFMMHTLNNIATTQALLNSTGCKWYMTSIGDIRELGNDLRQNDNYGELTNDAVAASKKGKKAAWKLSEELEVYNDPIWEDHADHWLMPFELFCQTCPEHTFGYIDEKFTVFLDLHPTPRQHILWMQQELKDKINLSDNLITSGLELSEHVEKMQQKFRADKISFDFSVRKKDKFPQSVQRLMWPGEPQGF